MIHIRKLEDFTGRAELAKLEAEDEWLVDDMATAGVVVQHRPKLWTVARQRPGAENYSSRRQRAGANARRK